MLVRKHICLYTYAHINMVKEMLTIMALIAAEKSLVLYASELSNEPHLLKAIRNKIKLASKSHFPNH